MNEAYFNTIDTTGRAEFKDRNSKFIGLVYPVKGIDDFKRILAEVKKEYAKAGHYCFAYRIGADGQTFRASDDGEPSGSAGKPILGQIDSKELTDVLVIVVRYFGGTLLGVPGLINAYKVTASLALQVTPVVKKPVMRRYHVQFDYTQLNDIMMIVKQYDVAVIKQELQLFCSIDIDVPLKNEEVVLYKLKDLREVKAEKTI